MARVKFTTVDEYMKSLPKETQNVLQTLRKTIHTELPGAEEVISYNIPCFKLNGKYVIYFAGYKKHVSIYPFSAAAQKTFPESADYNTSGKGTIQFPLDKPLPIPFIKRIVKFMLSA